MADLKNIALTVEAGQIATELQRWFGIADRMDLIRLGFAYAVANGVALDRDESFGTRGGSNYDSPGLDSEGLMAETVRIYYDNPEVAETPYRAVETLMNKGLYLLDEHRREGLIGSISDLAAASVPSAAAEE
jgi:hypothetical protein